MAVLNINGEIARATAVEIENHNGKALPLTMDVFRLAEIEPAVERVVKELGALDTWAVRKSCPVQEYIRITPGLGWRERAGIE